MRHLQHSPKGPAAKLPRDEQQPEAPKDYVEQDLTSACKVRHLDATGTIKTIPAKEQPFTAPGAKQPVIWAAGPTDEWLIKLSPIGVTSTAVAADLEKLKQGPNET
ncbi:hypothetical protein VP01_675g15 [Puccinia sorghi]|uniref:Uncharacterized protein n=1 Tax=Puccinia sorghi TaxID=27349 RepID=A0A0L6UFI5_9BASI|nr:hypothetical protein VP01_675g15 [Puccinia sorghi]